MRSSGGCAAALINILTIGIILIVLLVIGAVVAAFLAPDLVSPLADLLQTDRTAVALEPTPTLVALAVVPTATDTPTPPRLAPTWTPAGPETSGEATATNTRRPTSEPSITPTFPPPTNTPTPTDTPTPTETPGPSPTATNTRSPFPFTKTADSPTYLQNFANNAGCSWMGIGGQVFDVQGNPVPQGAYQVHVWGSGVDARVPVWSAPAYGPAGWEQFAGVNAPEVRNYNVQLETTSGTAVSEAYPVQTHAACNQNLVLFNFLQNH
jgi:hypothetical protein